MPKVYPDFGHPKGLQAAPWYDIRGEKLYPDFGHPDGIGAAPWFSIRGERLYPDFGHPTGIGAAHPGSRSGPANCIRTLATPVASAPPRGSRSAEQHLKCGGITTRWSPFRVLRDRSGQRRVWFRSDSTLGIAGLLISIVLRGQPAIQWTWGQSAILQARH